MILFLLRCALGTPRKQETAAASSPELFTEVVQIITRDAGHPLLQVAQIIAAMRCRAPPGMVAQLITCRDAEHNRNVRGDKHTRSPTASTG